MKIADLKKLDNMALLKLLEQKVGWTVVGIGKDKKKDEKDIANIEKELINRMNKMNKVKEGMNNG